MSGLKFADQLIRSASGDVGGGFNSRILGHSMIEAAGPHCFNRRDREIGWAKADDMARSGTVFSVHNFHHEFECQGHAFPYGGTFVCNTCGGSNLCKDWWIIKCFRDGSSWCCVGDGFEDLQASSNYAFGDTREEAIKNYGLLMVRKGDPT